ncbi:telomere-associated protein Tap [Streptomyces sp. NPDC051546]|uniref:telomere-associated protein Tap n=1 Tax=Streptomyces sp. NPDC051546 TaxID=3365655 RepID=UPI00379CB957
MSELFDAVDALIASRSVLPPPAERKRLRAAHGLTIDEVATALKVRRATVSGWESGKTEPRPPERDAYARLLKQLADLYPVPQEPAAPLPATFTGPSASAEAPTPSAAENAQSLAPAPVAALAPPAETHLEPATGTSSTSRRPAAKKAAPANTPAGGTDPRFENGPLAVVDVEDGKVLAYCTSGLVLDVPAKSLPSLVDWTLKEAKLGQSKLVGPGKDADPLIVLTEAALARYGLPVSLTEEEQHAGRIPEGHKVIKQLTRADWQLTKRGFGPWARIFRPAKGSDRQCVQLCIPSWNALDPRHWGTAGQLAPVELARLLGVYASRVMTPRGSTAVTGLELMTALHPPTYAVRDEETGVLRQAPDKTPGSLGKDPIAPENWPPCEVPDGHPVLKDQPRFTKRGPAEKIFEEAYDWARPLTDEECLRRNLVGLDVNMAFAAGANGLNVGLGEATHVKNPVFDPKLPGSWLVDLSHVDLSRVKVGKQWVELKGDLLPSPFTPKGQRPEGPAWYATPSVAYAAELGYDVTPTEAYVRYDSGRYLDGWYLRLRDAYLATMADLGVEGDMEPAAFLAAMNGYEGRDPEMALVATAIKATVKGGIGKLRERPRGEGWTSGEVWPALKRPTWRPDIRAAVISRVRINLHRKLIRHAAFTGQYPVAVNVDCVVYAVDGEGPLDFLPYREGKPLPGGFKLGVNPGLVKHEGTQSVLWGEQAREQYQAPELNLARYIKNGIVTTKDNGE